MEKSKKGVLMLTTMILSIGLLLGAQTVKAVDGDLNVTGGILLKDTNANDKIDEVQITVDYAVATATAIVHTVDEETTISKFTVTDSGTGNPVDVSFIAFVSGDGVTAVFKLVLDENDADLSSDVTGTALDVVYDGDNSDLKITDEVTPVSVATMASAIEEKSDVVEDDNGEEDNDDDSDNDTDENNDDNDDDDSDNDTDENNDDNSDEITLPDGAVDGPATPNFRSGVTLYRMPGSNRVYVIKNKKKQWIKTAKEFQDKGYKWNEIQDISAELLEKYPEAEALVANLFRAIGDQKVYRIKEGKKHWIRTAKEFEENGYNWNEIEEVSAETLATYQEEITTRLLKAKGDHRVYVITEGRKRWIRTAQEFNAAGYKWDEIREVISQTLEDYPDSELENGLIKIVNASALRVRSANSIVGDILGSVKNSETYKILEKKSGWYKIMMKSGRAGWVSGSYAKEQ